MDGRKRRYVPLFVRFAHGDTGRYLLDHFGHPGLLTWLCLLAAGKLGDPEGTFEYVSEEEGWRTLGLGYPYTPTFTLDTFFRATGRIKQTRKTTKRDLKHIEITRWEDWNDDWQRQQADERKARKQAQSTVTDTRPKRGKNANDALPEVEVEKKTSKEGTVFDCFRETWSPTSRLTDPRKRLVLSRLKEGFTVEDLCDAIRGAKNDPWPERPQHAKFETLLRDAGQVEKFKGMFTPNGGQRQPTTAAERYAAHA